MIIIQQGKREKERRKKKFPLSIFLHLLNRSRRKSKQLVVVLLHPEWQLIILFFFFFFFYRMNLMMIIIVIFIFSLINFSSSDQIITANLGQDVTFSCIFENEFPYNQVSFEFEMNQCSFLLVNRA
jgi:hypothetical protein